MTDGTIGQLVVSLFLPGNENIVGCLSSSTTSSRSLGSEFIKSLVSILYLLYSPDPS